MVRVKTLAEKKERSKNDVPQPKFQQGSNLLALAAKNKKENFVKRTEYTSPPVLYLLR